MRFPILAAALLVGCSPPAPHVAPVASQASMVGADNPAVAQMPAEGILARIVGVHDGDTVTALTAGNQQLKIRLDGIDAPELKQPHGQDSKQALSAMVFGKTVLVVGEKKDRYKRTLARLIVDGADMNVELVRQGWAWYFVKYSKDQTLAEAEREAREAKRGLWRDDSPVAPWEWRKAPTED